MGRANVKGNSTTAETRHPDPPGRGRGWVAWYCYEDPDGEAVRAVLRRIGADGRKTFSQWHRNGDGWESGVGNAANLPYRLPEIIAAGERNEPVYIAEGEKDVQAIEAVGGVATTNPGGAGKWRPEHTAALVDAGVKVVRIIWDRDEPGRRHALAVGAALVDAGVKVTYLRAVEGKDVTDHLASGLGLGDLRRAKPRMPAARSLPAAGAVAESVDPPAAFTRLLGKLLARGLGPREVGGGEWSARCPAHDDRKASLSFRIGDDRPVVVTCHAGCEVAAIADAAGMRLRDFSAPGDDEEPGRGIVRLADVEEREVEWLAPGLIPFGALTQIVGRGGVGKSTFAIHVAARLTRGEPIFPDMAAPRPASVLIVSAEDSIAHVLKARCRIAGADLTRVHAVDLGERDVVFPYAMEWIGEEVERLKVRLVFIDPLSAFLGGRVDSHKDASLRTMIRPIHAMAEHFQAAVLGVLHLNQSPSGDVATKTSGSGAWINAARSALVFGRALDADESEPQRIVALAKSNYAPPGVAHEVRLDVPAGEQHPKITYVGQSQVEAREVLAEEEPAPQSALTEAMDFLQRVLHDGEKLTVDVEAEAKAYGIATRTLKRARQMLRVVSRHEGFGTKGKWYLSLPDDLRGPMPEAPSADPGEGPLNENPVVAGDSVVPATLRGPRSVRIGKKAPLADADSSTAPLGQRRTVRRRRSS